MAPPPRSPPLPADAVALCQESFGLACDSLEGPEVPREKLLDLAWALKEDLDFVYFVYCTSTHFPADPGKDLPDRTLVAYRVRRMPNRSGRPTASFPFRVWVPTGEATPSLCDVWLGADWQEREQYDLVGTLFEDHPDLRRIMMPEDWPGHPLRRDYAIDTSHFPWR